MAIIMNKNPFFEADLLDIISKPQKEPYYPDEFDALEKQVFFGADFAKNVSPKDFDDNLKNIDNLFIDLETTRMGMSSMPWHIDCRSTLKEGWSRLLFEDREYLDHQQEARKSVMNYSTSIFLVNKEVRAVRVIYDPDDHRTTGKEYTFKTFFKDLKTDDLVIIPTNTRHKFTIAKVVAVDVDIDFDSSIEYKWIAGRFDQKNYDDILEKEKTLIDAVKSAEFRKRRDDLADAIFKDQEALKALPFANGQVQHQAVSEAAPEPTASPAEEAKS